jgi:hypothetical protein
MYCALQVSSNEFAETPMEAPLDGLHVRSQETLITDDAAIRVVYGQHVVTVVAWREPLDSLIIYGATRVFLPV